MLESLIGNLKTKDVEYKEYKSLAELSTVKIGGTARIIVEPSTSEETVYVLDLMRRESVPHKIVGRGSNILFPDGEYGTPIVRTVKQNSFSIDGCIINVAAGVQLPAFARMMAREGLSGMEELSGIPATLGGAIVGNAGAFGREISDVLLDCRVYDKESGETLILRAEELALSYRHSRLSEGKFVLLSAGLRLSHSDPLAALKRIEELSETRKRTQPSEPSLGSTFKRPKNGYASKMIDSLGLRGSSVGGAKISEKHAGFIINAGGATANDYIRISEIARERVLSEYGVALEYEIERF